ncbi:hypothetical protein T492DRAFT_876300, partial [Pavlovales sp. CCMP2436]
MELCAEVVLVSLSPNVRVHPPTADSAFWTVSVPPGAELDVGELVQATWMDSSATVLLSVELPTTVLLTLSPSVARVTSTGNPASKLPGDGALPNQFEIFVSDGLSQNEFGDYGDDPRLNVTASPLGCATVDRLTVTVLAGCTETLEVCVEVPPLANMSCFAMPVVFATGLELQASPWPAFEGSAEMEVSTLSKIGAASNYQRARISAMLALVTAIWAPFVASKHISFSAEPLTILGIELSTDLEQAGTFSSELNANAQLRVSLLMSDGTVLPDAQNLGFVVISDLLTFGSSDPAALTVGTGGALLLVGNSLANVTITAAAKIGGASTELAGAANLRPRPHDVDLGSETGPQLLQVGHQIELELDPCVLRASCESSLPWVVCSTSNPATQVRIVGYSVNSGVACFDVPLAIVTFEVLATAVSTLSGTIVDFVTLESEVPIIAGAGKLSASAPGGRRLFQSELLTSRPAGRQRRQLQSCAGCAEEVAGDVDGDCAFTSFDLAAYDAVNLDGGSTCAHSSDPNLDGRSSARDVYYLLTALAGKSRFVTSRAVTHHPFNGGALDIGGALIAQVTLTTDANELDDGSRTNVIFEIELPAGNYTPIFESGSLNGTSVTGHWLARAAYKGAGVFEVAVKAAEGWPAPGTTIGIAMAVLTADELGGSLADKQRKAVFLGA